MVAHVDEFVVALANHIHVCVLCRRRGAVGRCDQTGGQVHKAKIGTRTLSLSLSAKVHRSPHLIHRVATHGCSDGGRIREPGDAKVGESIVRNVQMKLRAKV